jgi:Rrf2 family iron-sulfur cluster assembly transcriptional regulator
VKVSTRGDYAARALLSLALHESDRPTSVKEIAERTNLPQPYLEQILLQSKGLSAQAVSAAATSARPPAEITVAEILAAVDGPLTLLEATCEGHCILQEVGGVSEEMGKILTLHPRRARHPDADRSPGSVAERPELIGGKRRHRTSVV